MNAIYVGNLTKRFGANEVLKGTRKQGGGRLQSWKEEFE